jgi:hypothetical protein
LASNPAFFSRAPDRELGCSGVASTHNPTGEGRVGSYLPTPLLLTLAPTRSSTTEWSNSYQGAPIPVASGPAEIAGTCRPQPSGSEAVPTGPDPPSPKDRSHRYRVRPSCGRSAGSRRASRPPLRQTDPGRVRVQPGFSGRSRTSVAVFN